MRNKLLLVAALLLATPLALPQPAAAAATSSAYRQADAALNAAWGPAFRAAQKRRTEAKLRAAQLAWVAFKDAEAKALVFALGAARSQDWLASETQKRSEFLAQVARGPIPEGSPNEEGSGTTAQYYAREDRRLNEVWRGVQGMAMWKRPQAGAAHVAAQQLWVRYRDAQAAYVHADGGSDLAWVKGRLSAERSEQMGD